jgi:hypothetical protein
LNPGTLSQTMDMGGRTKSLTDGFAAPLPMVDERVEVQVRQEEVATALAPFYGPTTSRHFRRPRSASDLA